MVRSLRWVAIIVLATTLAGCGTGQVRRISEPAASIQQLAVGADGGWSIELRLQNYSTVPMRFDGVALAIELDGHPAGTLQHAPAITVGPESADVVSTRLVPSVDARLAIAGALADGRGVRYTFAGTVTAAPVDRGKPRDYRIKRDSALSPVPGMPGVLR